MQFSPTFQQITKIPANNGIDTSPDNSFSDGFAMKLDFFSSGWIEFVCSQPFLSSLFSSSEVSEDVLILPPSEDSLDFKQHPMKPNQILIP